MLHIIINDFLTEEEKKKAWDEIDDLDFVQGTYNVNGKETVVDLKRNMISILNLKFPNINDSFLRSVFWNKFQTNREFAIELGKANEPFWCFFTYTTNELTKVSRYGNDDKYDWHTDLPKGGLITILYTISKYPESFTGGDFEIKGQDDTIKKIPFKDNSILIFPRMYRHRVTPVVTKETEWNKARFSVQWFVNIQ